MQRADILARGDAEGREIESHREATFNTAGICRPGKHYMLAPEARLGKLRKLIENEAYFVIHAPRQSGKTTSSQPLAEALTSEGRYAAWTAAPRSSPLTRG